MRRTTMGSPDVACSVPIAFARGSLTTNPAISARQTAMNPKNVCMNCTIAAFPRPILLEPTTRRVILPSPTITPRRIRRLRVHDWPRPIVVVVNECPGRVESRTIRGQAIARNARFASMTSRPVQRLLLTLAGHTIFCLFATSAPGQAAPGGYRQQSNPPGSSSAAEPPGTGAPRAVALIGKFELLATYTYAKALRDGLPEPEARQRGIVAAVMGARSRGVSRGGPRAP